MSKSVGNVVAPQQVMQSLGADILRLWVAGTDYRNEMTVSDDILKRVADGYRRMRNTARFLLGNLDGFDPAADLLANDRLLLLDRWAVAEADKVQQAVVAAYQRYEFLEVVQRVQNFCSNEMGALYLDITKDRLYTMARDSHGRRSAQSAMYRIVEAMSRWLAPIVSFTAEEIWQAMPGERGDSPLFANWYDQLAPLPADAALSPADFELLLQVRREIARGLEWLRGKGAIGASLDAQVVLHADLAFRERFAEVENELRFFLITSAVAFGEDPTGLPDDPRVLNQPIEGAPPSWRSDSPVAPTVLQFDADVPGHAVRVVVEESGHDKCVRCWHHRADVGSDAGYPGLCGRCVGNVQAVEGQGSGEQRRWF
jgi:isoleucyl-tRNA synthetase